MTRRGNTGTYEITTVGGELVQAFIPKHLPSDPPVALVCQRADLSFPTATKGIDKLMNLAIVKERTGGRRNRVVSYERYLAILNEGTEPF